VGIEVGTTLGCKDGARVIVGDCVGAIGLIVGVLVWVGDALRPAIIANSSEVATENASVHQPFDFAASLSDNTQAFNTKSVPAAGLSTYQLSIVT